MKKKTSILLVALFSILLISSCEKEKLETPSLSLSEVSIQTAKDATEKKITINTNQTEWTAISGAGWIKLSQSGNTLSIKIAANSSTVDREATITVIAGVIGETIAVSQKSDDISITLLPDAIEIEAAGGERRFDVNANTKDWTVKSEVDWIEVQERQFKNEVVLIIKENEKPAERTARLTLIGGSITKEFEVKQTGIIYHILPLLERSASTAAIMEFEKARNSNPLVSILTLTGKTLEFETQSKVFHMIHYELEKGKLNSAYMWVRKQEAVTAPNFDKFMADNGFSPQESDEPGVRYFSKKEGKYELIARVNVYEDGGGINFEFIPIQENAYKTFEKLPIGFISNFLTATKESIIELEKKNKGTNLNVPVENLLMFSVAEAEPLIARSYWFKEEAPHYLSDFSQYYNEVTLAFWNDEGKYIITREFAAKLAQERFDFFKVHQDAFVYKKFNQYIIFRVTRVGGIANGEPVLQFTYVEVNTKPNSAANQNQIEKMIDRLLK